MIAFIGLGNVGERYSKTKHNAGFWVIDELAKRNKATFKSGNGDYVYTYIKSNKVLLIKPTTGMNKSGLAVAQIVRKWGLAIADIFIIVDDIDLPLGTIRIRPKGGDGCHRGLENIIYQLRSKEFARIRFGIGAETNMRPSEKYVLEPFLKNQLLIVEQMINHCTESLQSIIGRGLNYTMNHYN